MTTTPARPAKVEAFDIDVFSAVPPEKPEQIQSLFIGREEELSTAMAVLRSAMDVCGRRGATHDKHPWIIHGESRSGKSHLARRIAIEFANTGRQRRIIVPCRQRVMAAQVMGEVFEAVRGIFGSLTSVADLQKRDGDAALVRLTRELSVRVWQLKTMAVSVTITISEEEKKALNLSFTASPIPKVLEFCLGLGFEAGAGKAVQVVLRQPTATDFAFYCGLMIDTLRRLDLLDHLFILVDDADLLDRVPQVDAQGRRECSELTDAIGVLHRTEGVDVLLTARSWYSCLNRDFQPLVDLGAFPSPSEEDLIRIHDSRMIAYRRSADAPPRFLTEEAIRKAARLAGGKPGLWLGQLARALERYIRDPNWEEKDYDWYVGVFADLIRKYETQDPTAASLLREAVNRGRAVVDVAPPNLYAGTPFDEVLWIDCYSRREALSLTQLAYEAVEALDRHETPRQHPIVGDHNAVQDGVDTA